jgi:hypothetical protein
MNWFFWYWYRFEHLYIYVIFSEILPFTFNTNLELPLSTNTVPSSSTVHFKDMVSFFKSYIEFVVNNNFIIILSLLDNSSINISNSSFVNTTRSSNEISQFSVNRELNSIVISNVINIFILT